MEIVEKVRRCLVPELATGYRLRSRFPVLAVRLGLQPYEKNCKFSKLICVEKVVSTGTFSIIIACFHTIQHIKVPYGKIIKNDGRNDDHDDVCQHLLLQRRSRSRPNVRGFF